MASSVATDKIATNWYIKNYDHDPGVNSVLVLSADGGTTQKWIDLRDYDHVAYLAVPTAGTTPNITLMEIIASETETTTNAVQIKTSGAVTVTALTGGVFVECSAEEVAHLATTYALRYVTARLTQAGHANDNEAQVIVMARARKPVDTLTAATWNT